MNFGDLDNKEKVSLFALKLGSVMITLSVQKAALGLLKLSLNYVSKYSKHYL